jgi:DNA-directed RNA polymerase subunit RPC12/RpoP
MFRGILMPRKFPKKEYQCIECGFVRLVEISQINAGRCLVCRDCAYKKNQTHGATIKNIDHKYYHAWLSMKRRCTYEKDYSYKNYGARGITICDRWLDFENFRADMGERPGEFFSVGRIDNNKGYCPENCRWETKHQQAMNRRNTFFVVYKSEKIPLKTLLIRFGLTENTTYTRIYGRIKLGWNLDEAISTPQRGYNKCRS